MLSAIRSFARSPIFGGLIIAFLIAAFALWGVEDIFRGAGNAVATVGSERVTAQEVNRTFTQQWNAIQRENPRATREQADEAGLGDQVIQQLVAQAALNAQARDLNLAVSDTRVVRAIQDVPAFRSGFSNRFDRAAYSEILRQQGWSEASFEAQIRQEMTRGQFIDVALSGVQPPALMAEARAAYEAEQRAIRALFLSPSLAGEIEEPDDAALEAFINEHSQIFQMPEQRRFTVVRISPDLLARDIEVDEDDLRTLYEIREEQGELAEPALRSYAQWSVAEADSAEAFAARLTGGEAPDAAAAELGLGAPTRQAEVQLYEIPDQAVANAVFEMGEGEARVVQSRLGLRVVLVEAADDSDVPSFEQMRGQLRAEYALESAEAAMFDTLGVFEEARAGGATLEEAANRAGLPSERYDYVAAHGFTMEGAPLMSLMESPEILREVFSAPVGFDTDLGNYGEDGYFVVRVDSVQEQRVPSLDEIREEAAEAWRTLQTDERLGVIADEAVARARAGETLDAIAADIGAGARVETSTLRRTETAGPFSRNVVGAAFSVRQGEPFEARGADQRTRVVGVVTAITADEAAPDAAIRQALAEEFENDMVGALERTLIGAYDVRINEDLRDAALGRTQPDDFQQPLMR